ncbi:MAG: hypothetical protein N2V71_07940, partial [Methanophagales archaeon]|nr:hypothetical protein [Methanophagales archaeon]
MIDTFGQSLFKCYSLYYIRNAILRGGVHPQGEVRNLGNCVMQARTGKMEPVNIRISKTKIEKIDE